MGSSSAAPFWFWSCVLVSSRLHVLDLGRRTHKAVLSTAASNRSPTKPSSCSQPVVRTGTGSRHSVMLSPHCAGAEKMVVSIQAKHLQSTPCPRACARETKCWWELAEVIQRHSSGLGGKGSEILYSSNCPAIGEGKTHPRSS